MQQDRLARFFKACIAVRTLLATAFVAAGWGPAWLRTLSGSVAAVLAFNFSVAAFRGKKIGAFQEPAWWAPLRPAHAAVWAAIAGLLFGGVRHGGALAALDPVIGVVSYVTVRTRYYNAAMAASDELLF